MYIRLSREDGDKQESESIGNQRKIIQRYIQENNLMFIKEYIDDGISGTTFDRPGFNELLHDIENKSINMVITKDLSRLGRDYIKTGEYIESYFPQNKVRYVAITDGIDTFADSTNNDITPFKAIMNDMYAKDISRKIRSVYKEKQKNGENLCSIPAFGYKKHPDIKNKLIIDNNVSDIVKKIFEMYANNHGCVEIANYLNNNKYLSPSGYRKTGLVQDFNKTNYDWNKVTLSNILKNEVYIGNTIQNKKTVVSYKVKKIMSVEKDKQIRVNNTHEPIINKDLFEKVQCMLNKRGTNFKPKYDYLLRGLLYCYHCKNKLQIVVKKKSNTNSYIYITCCNHKSKGCYPLNINYKKFENYIIDLIKKIIREYSSPRFLHDSYEKFNKTRIDTNKNYKKKIMQIDKLISETNDRIDKIYMDRLNGIILEDDYVRYYNKFTSERSNLITQKQDLEKVNFKVKENVNTYSINNLIESFLKLEPIEKIYLYRLIDKIEIDKNKKVFIHFNFSSIKIE